VNYHWNWRIFWEPAPNGTGTYLDMLLTGLVLTIETAICAWIIALVFGAVIGVLRTLPSKTASRVGFLWPFITLKNNSLSHLTRVYATQKPT
jgi:glutamate/aspartate transport system permease protein